MKRSRLLCLALISTILAVQLIDCSESDYEYEDVSDLSDIALNDTLSLNATEDDYYEYDDEEDDECTVDAVIDHYSALLLPDDYEEGKKMDYNKKSYSFAEIISRVKRLQQYQQNVSRKMDPIIKKVMPRLSELLFYIDLPSECMTALARIGQSAKAGDRWAMKFLDAQPSGNPISLNINSPPFGEYDECLSIESKEPALPDKPKIYGHYCSLGIPSNLFPKADISQLEDNARLQRYHGGKLKKDLEANNQSIEARFLSSLIKDESDGTFAYDVIRYLEYQGLDQIRLPTGLCLPSACDPKDVEWAINKIIYPFIKFNIIINPDCDYKGKPVHLDKYHILTITAFAILGGMVTISTIIYFLKKRCLPEPSDGQPLSQLSRISHCFAIVPNFKAIFSTKARSEKFSALDGIRAILCYWMFLQHEYEMGFIPLWAKKMRRSAPHKFSYDLKYILFVNWNLTDTFFLMAGMLTCYVVITRLDRSRRGFDYIQYALYRYLRMIPAILAAIGITIIFDLFGEGPVWPLLTGVLRKPCIDNPWQTITMTNNYVSWPDMLSCVPISWYTAADMQLYLLAPFIILALYYWPTVGIIWNILIVIVGSVIAIAPKVWFGIPHLYDSIDTPSPTLTAKVVSHNYWGLEQHVQLYVLGIFMGYLIKRHPKAYLGGRIGELFIWLLTWSATTYAIFWHRNYLNVTEYRVTYAEVVNWLAFSKVCYASGWCWAFYACITGRAGFIGRFFSWGGFKPFAYLMLEIYLLHLFIILYRVGTLREHVFYSDYYVLTVMVYDFILTFILSVTVNLLVTKPFANLLDLFMKKNETKPKTEDEETLDLNNNGKLASNGKVAPEDTNEADVVVLKNVAIDGIEVITDKQKANDSWLQNLEPNNENIENKKNEENKEVSIKL